MSGEHTNGADGGAEQLDAVIVGAGFGGMYMLIKLRELGLSTRVIEAGDGVGGTWYWNRYPGARCDVESMQYSYQFDDALQQEWEWTERYAAQPEILRYANHVADRYDLRRDIRFSTRVTAAQFDEAAGRWRIRTDDGHEATATYLITAVGCLSTANLPRIPGTESFRGKTYHTGQWPHEGVDFTGQRVGVIGTGSSAVQSIPQIAKQAAQLYVFQRTPNYMVPAHNAPLDAAEQARFKADYPRLRAIAKRSLGGILLEVNNKSALDATQEERDAEFERRWQKGGFNFMAAFNDLGLKKESNDTAAAFVRSKIRAIVQDPQVAELLSPTNVMGCKRLCVDIDYWQTYNRPNVTLVDVSRQPVEAITADGVRVDGKDHAVDAIVFATGFDAMTGALLKMNIKGRGGVALKDKWAEGPKTYLGLGIAGFPNLFTITGPGSPSVLSNMITAVEQHADWIADCIAYLRGHGLSRIEALPEAQEDWVAHARSVGNGTLRETCNSWYLGANIPGKPRVLLPYTGGLPAYIEKCADVVAKGYEGFALS